MDLTKETIDKIENLVEGKEKIVNVGGKEFSRHRYERVFSDPRPSSLGFSTLDGIPDYINTNLDSVKPEACMIVIDSFEKVSIYSPVTGEKNDRHLIAETRLADVEKFQFGKFMDQESFIISFSSLFGETEDKKKILAAVSVMQVIDQMTGDDKAGTTKREASNQVICPGLSEKDMPKTVVVLKPFRTFREIEQPASAFIFRYKSVNGSPYVALIEADGGAWKIEAKKRIKDYLLKKVTSPIIS